MAILADCKNKYLTKGYIFSISQYFFMLKGLRLCLLQQHIYQNWKDRRFPWPLHKDGTQILDASIFCAVLGDSALSSLVNTKKMVGLGEITPEAHLGSVPSSPPPDRSRPQCIPGLSTTAPVTLPLLN